MIPGKLPSGGRNWADVGGELETRHDRHEVTDGAFQRR